MTSSLSRSACLSPLAQQIFYSRLPLLSNTCSIECIRVRRISKQTRQRKQTTSPNATRNVKTGSASTHDTVAKLEARPPLRSISQEALTASSYDLSPTLPHPQNDLTSTRPAPLDLPNGPTRERDGSVALQNRVSYFYQLGKAYLKFYKTGFKHIWSNYKEYRPLWKRFYGLDINGCIKYGSIPKISRREFQLYQRTAHDLKKLLPFGLVFAVCGEFTPLVITLLGTAVVPYTCRIPKQVEQNLQKVLDRMRRVERINQQHGRQVRTNRALAYIHNLDPFGLIIRDIPLLSSPLWRYWIQPKFKQHIDNLICDAILITKEGGTQRLDPAELFQFAINIRKPGTIRTLLTHHTLGDPSRIPDQDIKQMRKEVQVFIDEIRQVLMQQESRAAGSNDRQQQQQQQPEEIFVAAARRAAATGMDAPYVLPSKGA